MKRSPKGPYKGLIPYTEADYPYFFGRSGQARILAANIASSPVTVIYGPSGVGKSSLLAAGVVRELEIAAEDNLQDLGRLGHIPILFRNWNGDYRAALATATSDKVSKLGAVLPEGASFEKRIEGLFRADPGRPLLILDQFEEFFLYHGAAKEVEALGRLLRNLVDQGCHLALSLREDQLAILNRMRSSLPEVFENHVRVGHLNSQAAREAIEGPISRWNELEGTNWSAEPALVDELLEQLQPDRLNRHSPAESGLGKASDAPADTRIQAPWLQIVMTRLWMEETKTGARAGVLRLSTLVRLKGVARIGETHLKGELADLNILEKFAAAAIFKWLVTPSGSRIIYPKADLIGRGGVFRRSVPGLLTKLSGDGRILEPIGAGDSSEYQIYHNQLGPAILKWRSRFLLESWLVAWGIVALVPVLFFVYLAMDNQTLRRKSEVTSITASALASLALTDLSPDVRKNLALLALSSAQGNDIAMKRAAEVVRAEFPVAVRHFGFTKLLGVAFSPNAQLLALTGEGDCVWLMKRIPDPRKPGGVAGYDVRLIDTGGAQVISAALALRYLATSSGDGYVRIYDPATGDLKHEIKAHQGAAIRVAINQNEDKLASAGADQMVKLWATGSGKNLKTLSVHKGVVNDVEFSSRQNILVSADESGTIAFWDLTGSSPPVTLDAGGPVVCIHFSPSGYLLSGGTGGIVRQWDNSKAWSLSREFSLHQPVSALGSVALPQGDLVGTRSGGFGRLAGTLEQLGPAITWMDVSSGGTRVATTEDDATFRLWDQRPKELRRISFRRLLLEQGGNVPGAVAFTDSRSVAGLWDLSAGRWARIRFFDRPITSLDYAAHGSGVNVRDGGNLQGTIQPMEPPANSNSRLIGSVAYQYANDLQSALDVAKKSPPAPLTPDECRRYLGVTPCPAITIP